MKLIKQERPPVGTMVLDGHQFWAEWAMVATLGASMLVGMMLGRLKIPWPSDYTVRRSRLKPR